MNTHYDVIIIGSGAGGGTMARALATSAARVLVLERGSSVPQEADNWNPEAVWKHLRYRTTERWLDAQGEEFLPYTHYGVGGNTKFWGSVLYRLRREDFQAIEHRDGVSPAWPIDYDTLEPYYERAERLYHVHGQHGGDPTEPPRGPFPFAPIPHSSGMAAIVDELRRQGLHPSHLPLGLIRPGEPGGCVLCSTCNSFPCRIHAKSDAEVCGIEPALANANVTLWTNARALRLVTDPIGQDSGGRRGRAQRRDHSRRRHAHHRVVRCRQLCGVASAIGERHPSRRPRELVRTGRAPLHGAPRDDDAGVSSAAEERHGVSEDRGDQRFLLPRAGHASSRSATSSRRGGRTA